MITKRKIHMTIKFITTKNGKRRALYWSIAKRWLPIAVDLAEIKIATGEAMLQGNYALDCTKSVSDKGAAFQACGFGGVS